ncbi:bifunctional riboflavin kinase/FAD synthetase [Aerophototrophica crusticola]|uniref:Riboflavin biosynthesis protein n=1 Tax=Aerophototrophica crusticola TaxID=1709002 RepID=A0A858RC12_9PROT|nr:bifunctional riboflavin kinase/FAD synthetase [Rhodospirillaceae bacterium B3]
MKLFRHTTDLPPDARGVAVALGNFDGVHRGHRAVIGAAQEAAAKLGVPSAVLTFEPHPRALFKPDQPPFRLTPFRIKARLVEALGVDALFSVHFDRAFSQQSAEAFVESVLVQGLGARHVVAGYDFVFGHNRGGDMAFLRAAGERFGFGVTEVRPVADPSGIIFSSTKVRELLQAGEAEAAAAILGHPFEVEGRVEHGDKRGRTIGFPTANVELGEYVRPRFGVYAVRAGVDLGGQTVWHDGVANLGRRPTVGGAVERLEVHLFDFDGDLYGRHLRVRLLHFLRPEMKFDGLDHLKAQIARDAGAARAWLAADPGAEGVT